MAIKDPQEAVRRGLKDRAVIETDPQLQSLRADPDFQRLLSALQGN